MVKYFIYIIYHPFFLLLAMALYKQKKHQIRQISDHHVSLSDKWLDVNWSLIGKKNDNLPEESLSQLAGFKQGWNE